ncbi:MAG TPA: hypothetical protein PLZ36_05105 [Armatimonadota bacterium]|nr:hypothetical protein [Armatimonadota bacterium]
MARILLLWALAALLGAAAFAQGGVLVGATRAEPTVVVGAPASDEVTVVRLLQVNYLSVPLLTRALGGQVLYLYGGGAPPLGVIADARDAMSTLFAGGSRGGREQAPPPAFSTRTGPVAPYSVTGGR